MDNVAAIKRQLELIIQQAQAAIEILPCEHIEVEMLEGATMGNVKYRCKQCGEVISDG